MRGPMLDSRIIVGGISRRRKTSGETGMSIIELLIAMTVLTVGMLGSMIMILTAMQSNSRNKNDTTATVLDQEILETFATLKNYPQVGSVNIYDCSGNAVYYLASYGQGTFASGGSGAPLTATGDIDWTQPTPALATSTTAGYAMQYTNCSGDIYEVRWNVRDADASTPVGTVSRLSILTVSSRQQSASSSHQAMLFAPPTTLRTLLENGAY
jgi:Tfp pilus assembly protein PilV